MLLFKTLIIVVQVLSALGVIGLVLLQHGKGADMGAAFGSGASGSLFGATGSANFLSRTTAVLATVFFVATLALTYIGSYKSTPSAGVLGGVATATVLAVFLVPLFFVVVGRLFGFGTRRRGSAPAVNVEGSR
ncbi:preprotein translocase subunit SecG [Burkholderia multivorans]|nr:preprotein translocase subunit SecG [Burkholderia multivorans]